MRFVFASEVGARDGMAVEMWTGSGPDDQMVAEVFRDDLVEPPSFIVTLFVPLSLEDVESLIVEAHRRFD